MSEKLKGKGVRAGSAAVIENGVSEEKSEYSDLGDHFCVYVKMEQR